jgi:hypothetical protein
MNDDPAEHAGLAIRASDAEREQTVALLQRNFTDGRLTQPEFEERVGAAFTARTRDQLRDLTADLPDVQQPSTGTTMDPCPLIILLCVCPPAALAYWLISRSEAAPLRAWLVDALDFLGHLAGVLAGVVVAGARRAFPVRGHQTGRGRLYS